ncbi:MAG TPA: hypothetical protein PKK06_08670 [Phycisphaerae bacterium]|nr:hypothetical protein [Phycisphaerae bacterium]HNU45217.1 hypothetical protein [Phycisphaerae bacterium]
MRDRNLSPIVGVACFCLLGTTACTFGGRNAAVTPPGADAEAYQTWRTQGAQAAMTVLPVEMMSGPHRDAGDVIGAYLEKLGMPNIQPNELVFNVPSGTDFEQVPKLLGEFVRQHPLPTDYAVYAQFVGTPQTSVQEIRAVVVHKAGTCVWIDRQGPDDKDFQRQRPGNPMTCCVLVGDRLSEQLNLPGKPAGDPEAGTMAQVWAAKSGTPPPVERDAMQARVQKLRTAGADATLTVFPVAVGDQVEPEAAGGLARHLQQDKLCRARVAQDQPRFQIAPSSNEQRRLWDLARAFQAYVKEHRPDTDYSLYAEYTFKLPEQEVWTVHFVVCDRDGAWVIVDFQNNHQPDFQRLAPKTRDDCNRLVAERLKGYVR